MSIEEQINKLKSAIANKNAHNCMRLTLSYTINQLIDVDVLEHALATILLAKNKDDEFPHEEYYLSFMKIFKVFLTKPGWNNLALIVDGESLWIKFTKTCIPILLGTNLGNNYPFEDATESYIKNFSAISRTILPNFLTALAKLEGNSENQIVQYKLLKYKIVELLVLEKMHFERFNNSGFTNEQLELASKFITRFIDIFKESEKTKPTLEFTLADQDNFNSTSFDPWKPLLANYEVPNTIEEVLQKLNAAIINQDALTTARLTYSLDTNIQLSVDILELALMTLVAANCAHYKSFSYKPDYISFANLLCALFAKPEWDNFSLIINGESLWLKLNNECKNILLGDAVHIYGLNHNDNAIIEKLASAFDPFKPRILAAISNLIGTNPKTNQECQNLKEEVSGKLLDEIGLNYVGMVEKMSETELATYWNFIGKFGNFNIDKFCLIRTTRACRDLFSINVNIKSAFSEIVKQSIIIYPGQQQSALVTAAGSKQPQIRLILFCIRIKFEHKIESHDLDCALEQALQILIVNAQISLITKGDELEAILSFLYDFAFRSGASVTKDLYLKLNSYVQAQINLQPALGTYIDLNKHGLMLPEIRSKNLNDAPRHNINTSKLLF